MLKAPSRRGSAAVLICAAALMSLLLAEPRPVWAHPADMYAQNLSVRLRGDALLLEWQVLPGPFLADAVWAAADGDQDDQISASEAAEWIAPFVAGLAVRMDEAPLTHGGPQDIHWPTRVEAMRTVEDRITWQLQIELEPVESGPRAIAIHAAYLEDNCLNWFSIEAEEPWAFDIPRQDNGELRLTVYPGAVAPSASRRTWTSGTPNVPALALPVPPSTEEAVSAEETTPARSGSLSSVTETLTQLVKTQDLSPLFLGGAFLLSLALGSLHALTPGHGKALVGAYLVGSQGRTRDAVFLGAIVTVTHTGSVVLLGLVTLLASHYFLPALIAPWLEIISGVLVIGFGLNLLFQRGSVLRRWLVRGRRRLDVAGGNAHDHAHGPPHEHGHSHEHDHVHHSHELEGHSHAQPAQAVTMRSLLTLGISGGLVPCPDAIAILLVAVAINRIPLGMLLILAFSIGLALVLIGIGIAMVNGFKLIARSAVLARSAIYAPLVSAVVVTALGAALTASAVKSLQFGTAVVQSAAGRQPEAEAQAPRWRLLYIAADSAGRDQLFMKPPGDVEPIQYTREPTGITGYTVSPDQSRIVYTTFQKEGGTAIWTIDADGTGRRLVLDCPRSECNAPHWYPDGTMLAYERLDDITEPLIPRFSIWWLDFATGSTFPMFQDSALASYSPQFSPDGAWLSYVSSPGNTLIIFNLINGESRSVQLGSLVGLPGSWSPASDQVLFGSYAAGEPLRMRVFDLNSGSIRVLGAPEEAADYSSAWSPDGEWIAIDRNVPLGAGVDSNQVWLVRPDGTDSHAVLDEPGASYSSLVWSPDSRQLLFTRYVLDVEAAVPGRFDIYTLDVPGGEVELLLEGGDMPVLLP